jgi:hypothetical protein
MRCQPRLCDQNVGDTKNHWFTSDHRWQDDMPPGFGRPFLCFKLKVVARVTAVINVRHSTPQACECRSRSSRRVSLMASQAGKQSGPIQAGSCGRNICFARTDIWVV